MNARRITSHTDQNKRHNKTNNHPHANTTTTTTTTTTRGQFLTHQCTGPYRYKATLATIEARANGEAGVSAYCEAGELEPTTGLLKIWLGNATACPKTSGPPTFTNTRVGK